MKRICAWCGTAQMIIEEDENGNVTHTICDLCAEMIREEMRILTKGPELEPIDTLELLED